ANVLAAAVEARVVADLLNSSAGVPYEVTAGRLARRLADELALTDEAAHWAVESWAAALGGIPPPTRPTAADRTARAAPPAPAPPSIPPRQVPTTVQPVAEYEDSRLTGCIATSAVVVAIVAVAAVGVWYMANQQGAPTTAKTTQGPSPARESADAGTGAVGES